MPMANVKGFSFFYADDDFAAPWPPHDTVFLQPYVRGSHRQWRSWIPALASEYRVIRMDRRGNGYSEKPPPDYEYTLAGYLDDFVGFLNAIGVDRVHYVGESLGSVLGVAFAVTHPERVQSLVLCHPLTKVHKRISDNFARRGYPDGPTAVMAMGEWAYAHSRWMEQDTEYIRDRLANGAISDVLQVLYRAEEEAMIPAHVLASIYRLITQPDFDISGILSEIQAPTLLISPDQSRSTSPDEQAMILDRIPNCEQIIAERAGFMWRFPQDIAVNCADFIRRHPTAVSTQARF